MHSPTSSDPTARPGDSGHGGHSGHCQRLKDWLSKNLVQEVPKDVAICEFDCSKLDCCRKEFDNCPRRLSGRSLGMPDESATRKVV